MRRPRGRISVALRLLLLMTAAGAAAPSVPAQALPAGEHGLPFTRFYSFDEIGRVSRGARLGFDPLGRVAVTRAGSCLVLNDTAWVDLAGRDRETRTPDRRMRA